MRVNRPRCYDPAEHFIPKAVTVGPSSQASRQRNRRKSKHKEIPLQYKTGLIMITERPTRSFWFRFSQLFSEKVITDRAPYTAAEGACTINEGISHGSAWLGRDIGLSSYARTRPLKEYLYMGLR